MSVQTLQREKVEHGLSPSRLVGRGLKPNAFEVLQQAQDRGCISTKEMTSLLTDSTIANRAEFAKTVRWFSLLLSELHVSILTGGKEIEHQKKIQQEALEKPRLPTVARNPIPKIPKEKAAQPLIRAKKEPRERAERNPRVKKERKNDKWLEESAERIESALQKGQIDFSAAACGNDPLLADYFNEMHRYPLISREETMKLFERVEQGDPDAVEAIVNHNLRLVVTWARKYRNRFELADLIQEGNMGMLIAIKQFNRHAGFAFGTYATWWIKSKIRRYMQNYGRTIRVPVHTSELDSKIRRAGEKIAVLQGRPPTLEEIAAELAISTKVVKDSLWRMRTSTISLDCQTNSRNGDEGSSVGSLISNNQGLQPLSMITAKEEYENCCERIKMWIQTMASIGIPYRHRLAFSRYYGMDNLLTYRTLEVVGNELGVTRERIRQMIVSIWGKLGEAEVDIDSIGFEEETFRLQRLADLTSQPIPRFAIPE